MSRTWIGIGVVIVLLAIGIGILAKFTNPQIQGAQLWPSLWAIVLSIVVVGFLAKAAGTWAVFLNYFLFALCGGALGWVIGIIASPASADEERVFGEYKTAIVGFLSGFAVSKINDIWKMISTGNQPLLLSAGVLNRLLLFTGMFLLLVAQQYNVRQSAIGQLILSASIQPSSARVDQTAGTITVRPGAKLTLKGAAPFEDMDVDWSLKNDGSAFFKAVNLDNGVLAIPETGDSRLKDLKKGSTLSLVATSRWNRSKTGILQIILDPTGTTSETKKIEQAVQPKEGNSANAPVNSPPKDTASKSSPPK